MSFSPDNHSLFSVLELAPTMSFSVNTDLKIDSVNDNFLKKMGYERAEILNTSSFGFIEKEGSRRSIDTILSVLAGVISENIELQFQKKSGEKIDVVLSIAAHKDDCDKIQRVVVFVVDVSEHKKVLNLNANMDDKLQVLLSAVKFGVWDYYTAEDKLVWDDRMFDIYSVDQNKFKHNFSSWEETVHAEDIQAAKQKINEAIIWNKHFNTEFRVVTPSGKIRYVRGRARVFRSENGEAYRMLGINWDVTEEKETQMALVHALKFAALGEMAGGVAHEINNPLTIIDGYVQKAVRQIQIGLTDKNTLIDNLNKVSTTVKRIAKIVEGMQKYSRDSSSDPYFKTSVSEIVEDTLDLCREKFKHNGVKILTKIDTSLFVNCHTVEISQALLNLLNNAFDAISEKKDKWIEICINKNIDNAEIQVIDSGDGIPIEKRQKVLEPFYTSKPPGKGVGMGLSISKGIVEAHGGSLEVLESYAGARFSISIPLSSEVSL